ncbi:MAG: hypothetical protein SOT71_10240, partial [Romboutsia timonensis]|uniref:hypothetical protein n=1 Tax=Romboutsia timonensis TaxID=1776391 RepID=UPI002A760BF5
MYKKNNNQASEFETFASTLESMVNDYISVDKECATRIKSNGKNHRKNTGLAKNLALATICASFDKIGNKLGDIADNVKDWVEGVIESIVDGIKNGVEWLIDSIKKDWKSWLQLAGAAVIGLVAAAFMLNGGWITLGIGGLCLLMQLDKGVGAVADIFFNKETDGDSYTQSLFGDGYDKAFNVADAVLSSIVSGLISKAAKLIPLSKIDDITQLVRNMETVMTLENMSMWLNIANITNIFSNVSGYIQEIFNGDIEQAISDGIDNSLLDFIGDSVEGIIQMA